MRLPLPVAAFVMMAPAVGTAAVQPSPALKQALAESAKAPVVAFERTQRAELRADPDKEPAVVVDRFVPSSAESGTWTLVSIDGRAPTPDEVKRHRKANAGGPVPGFHRLHMMLAGTPTQRQDAEGCSIFRWDGLQPGSVMTPAGDISAKLAAEATVEQVGGKPIISKVRIFAAKPFRIRGIATMNQFDVISHYKPGEQVPFLTAQTASTDVKAPFGLGGKRRNQISFRPL